MSDSFPVQEGDGTLHHRDCEEPYERLVFLQERVALLFQEKIGLRVSHEIKTELAFLGAIRLLNRYHFKDIDLPVEGSLKLTADNKAFDAVIKARSNEVELISRLTEFRNHLEKEAFFHDAREKANRCLIILSAEKKTPV